MRTILVILAGLAGLAMTGTSALASDCAEMRANLSAAVSGVLAAASADPIELADLTAKVNGADAALKALTDACGDQAKTATMPAATAVMGPAGSGEKSGETQRPSPSEMMERTGRTHVTVGDAGAQRRQRPVVVAEGRGAGRRPAGGDRRQRPGGDPQDRRRLGQLRRAV